MGNSQAKESRPDSSRGHTRRLSERNPSSPTASGPAGSAHHERSGSGVYNSRTGRGSRHDLSFLGLGGGASAEPAPEPRRETKAEREARKLEKERAQRAVDREKSLREEGVDGGFLVTLGTYTGPEDFSKPAVRQLQIERRMAPFWKGLEDFEDTWVEHQLVAIVNGRPLPPPDEIPPEEPPRPTNLGTEWNPRSSNGNINHLTVPISSRSMSQQSERSMNLSPSHPAFSLPPPTSPIATSPSSSPFFRGRAKTLAAQMTGSRNNSQIEMAPREIELPKDPYVNGQRIETFLYKNASECPICFLYYPPYLNKTRCCDQSICSECFVQIKRPDPHPPEHHDPSDTSAPPPEPQEDGALVSEPAACPYCAQPEFGVTYEPPPFRRGLAYANQGYHSMAYPTSAMSSTSSLNSQGLTSPGRRRATSLAANDNTVITTDRVRPDWAKKLADARSHALRRAAAATALHNAAYMMGTLQADSRGFSLGRRRRTMFGNDSGASSGHGTPRRDGDVGTLLGATISGGSSSRNEGQSDLFPGRHSSRGRMEDLEELMMMEAIRLSLAAEEERKKKDEKEAAKEARKEDKKKAKESKRSERTLRRIGIQPGFHPAPPLDGDDDIYSASSSSATGKGKAVDRSGGSAGLNVSNEPTPVIDASSSKDTHQRHLEESRAQIHREPPNPSTSRSPFDPFADQPSHRSALRNLSNPSSSASSFADSLPGSLQQGTHAGFGASGSSFEPSPNESGPDLDQNETPPQVDGTPGTEPMFNFRSLAAVITNEDGMKDDSSTRHIENVTEAQRTSEGSKPSQDHGDKDMVSSHDMPDVTVQPPGYSEAPKYSEPSGTLEESVTTLRPSVEEEDEISPTPQIKVISDHSNHLDSKHIGDVNMIHSRGHQHTQ